MPAVFVASANGMDTSPVIRGIYLLENIMGYKVPEPPEGIEGLNPDIRGSKSIRDLLQKHSSDESCHRCHQKIDPMGFALESFGPLGKWRTKYSDKQVIDSSGILPNGTAFKDISVLKKALLKDIDSVNKNLITMLLVYSSGREMGPLDGDEIERLCQSVKTKGYGLRDLIVEVMNSEILLHKQDYFTGIPFSLSFLLAYM